MTVLVTGGTRGIGAAIVRRLREDGREVVALGSQDLDVADEAAWERLAATLPALDGLVCAAAVLDPVGPLGTYSAAAFWRTMEVNVLGTLLAIQHARPAGPIVTFSGGGATSPLPRYDAYATSKAAVVRLTENLAAEGLAINCVAPGFVATDMHRATFAAGAELAGEGYLAKTREQVRSGGVPPQLAAELTAYLLTDPPFRGKLISAQWDPWRDEAFRARLAAEPDLATLRRIDDEFFSAVDR